MLSTYDIHVYIKIPIILKLTNHLKVDTLNHEHVKSVRYELACVMIFSGFQVHSTLVFIDTL